MLSRWLTKAGACKYSIDKGKTVGLTSDLLVQALANGIFAGACSAKQL